MFKSSFVKKFIAVTMTCTLAAGAFALAGCSGSGSSSSSSSSNTASASSSASSQNAVSPASNAQANLKTTGDMTGIHHAEMIVTGYDPIEIELDADSAPITVSNFVDLVNEGYYDGLAFYRIQDGFVIQGGTKGNTASGNDKTLDAVAGEFSSNGYENPLADAYGEGYIAMARTSDPDSATSTFFITLAGDNTVSQSLNGQYAAFGKLDEAGMATLTQIVSDYSDKVDPSSPMGIISDEANMPIIEKITIVD